MHELAACRSSEVNRGSKPLYFWELRYAYRVIYLDCRQYLGTKRAFHVNGVQLPLTNAQLEEIERPSLLRFSKLNKLPLIRLINIKGGDILTVRNSSTPFNIPSVLCNKLPAKTTWSQSPTGYEVKRRHKYDYWVNLDCKPTLKYNEDPSTCFTNHSIHILGDSNGRKNFVRLCRSLNATSSSDLSNVTGWHFPLKCVRPDLNISVTWHAHANPFSSVDWAIQWKAHDITGINQDVISSIPAKGYLVPTSTYLDQLPSCGRLLVVLHHYFHFTMYHISAYHAMVVSIRDAVKRLVERNSEVLVVVRGPHSLYKGWDKHYVGGDGLGRFMEEILIQEFRDLSEGGRVIYLRTWDMTVATVNTDQHPGCIHLINQRLINLMCGRL